ncbi:PREDICTED: uncharacterized protein LOC107106344 [Gekko japonicus]|uniref:Uncharacterized protein LOC107106344 n=1 Tax=Gekko japonicus TaxID=146911 RepID=A0ABM1JKH6_GEKJA|nr:PREDICTED: uncharacterized protein LOC107106344 [Gekko japonicus]
MTTTEEGVLQFPVQLEQGPQTDIKMEEESSTGPQLSEEESRKAPHVLQAGTIGGFLQRSPGEDVKQEQDEGQLQRWEVQWQEFLKTMEGSQSSWKNPQLRGECVSSGEVRPVPPLLQGQPVTLCHTVGEHVSRDLPDPCEPHGRAHNRLECGDFGQVKEKTEGQEALGTEVQRQCFRQFLYLEAEGPLSVCCQLRELCHRWLQPERRTKEQILELVILEQFLAILPPEMLNWVKQHGPETCSQAATLAEEFLLEKQAAEGPEEQDLHFHFRGWSRGTRQRGTPPKPHGLPRTAGKCQSTGRHNRRVTQEAEVAWQANGSKVRTRKRNSVWKDLTTWLPVTSPREE